ncbi:MAG: hypothetical protein MR423_01660 [Firmicutes bacterium]|nr:hypothetical protein [Bacillota bacterium]
MPEKKQVKKSKKTDEVKVPFLTISNEKSENTAEVEDEILDIDFSQDFNKSEIFNVNLYRDVFMELRRQLDDLSARRGKSDKTYAEYDDAVYNITASSATNPSAQDFLGYCYKKGFYDFCLMNYEKYMKWTILAAANGNAFSLSKLQIYLTTALDTLLSIPNISDLQDFMELKDDNFIIFLSKMICDEIVNIMEISAEKLIKMPEKYLEQTEENQKEFDKAKFEATKKVSQKIKKVLVELDKEVTRIMEEQQNSEQETETTDEEQVETPVMEEVIKQKPENTGNKFKRNLDIKKKFRY